MAKSFVMAHQRVKDAALSFIRDLPTNGKFEVVIRTPKSKRSLAQNRLLHMWIACIRDGYHEGGGELHSADVWKEHLCKMFLVTQSHDIGGAVVETRKSTANLGIKEMTDFLEKIDMYAASELGILLPSPQDLGLDYRA